MSRSPEIAAYHNMIHRCYNPKNKNYHLYGARGIRVNKKWILDMSTFLKDIGPRPGPEYSLDRIKNNGNYTRSNVRWATQEQQNYNRRPRSTNRPWLNRQTVLEIFNLKDQMAQADVAKLYNIHLHTVSDIQTGKHYTKYTGLEKREFCKTRFTTSVQTHFMKDLRESLK